MIKVFRIFIQPIGINLIVNLNHIIMATADIIHSHSYQHFENLQMSAQEFYSMLETLIKDYQYPDVLCKTEELKEGGMFSAKRKYLSISWQRHSYYVCASPFGRSFFISWWHQEGANTGANIASKFGVIGKAVAGGMESKTFFETDNELMFINCITAVIKTAIERVKAEKGFTVENPQLLH